MFDYCLKCRTPYNLVAIQDDLTKVRQVICHQCLNKFLNRLAAWKDFELSEEIDLFLNPPEPKI